MYNKKSITVMKKSKITWALLALVTVVMTSCWNSPTPEQGFKESALLGLWAKTNATNLDTVPTEFVRFTSEQDESGEYKYAREWNEEEDIYEEDLKPYGNGWFKYKLANSGDLEVWYLMDNGGADIPKTYKVIKLDSYELQYKDQYGKTHYWSKMGDR
jgi:hypothetical protein